MNDLNIWDSSPESLCLDNDDVHVWRVRLDQSSAVIECLQDLLTPDELARVIRFHFPQHRARFIVARGALRTILGYYTGISPEKIGFGYSSYGKPFLDMSQLGNTQSLHFNVSHSSDIALIALTRFRNVGVDIERLRHDVPYARLVRRYFTPCEQTALFALPSNLHIYAFYNLWTRKEAYLKAIGIGFSHTLDGFKVDLTSNRAVESMTRPQTHGNKVWKLLELIPGPGYAATLAVAGRDWKLSCWQWK